MFECLAGRDAIERPAAKRQPGQIAEDDGDAHVAANVQHGVKRSIDSEYSEALLLQPLRELPQPNGGVENARVERKLLRLGEDDREAVFVSRPEHLGLRAPLVSVCRRQDEGTLTPNAQLLTPNPPV